MQFENFKINGIFNLPFCSSNLTSKAQCRQKAKLLKSSYKLQSLKQDSHFYVCRLETNYIEISRILMVFFHLFYKTSSIQKSRYNTCETCWGFLLFSIISSVLRLKSVVDSVRAEQTRLLIFFFQRIANSKSLFVLQAQLNNFIALSLRACVLWLLFTLA